MLILYGFDFLGLVVEFEVAPFALYGGVSCKSMGEAEIWILPQPLLKVFHLSDK